MDPSPDINPDLTRPWHLDLGARVLAPDTVRFKVWAPRAETMNVELHAANPRSIPLTPTQHGYWEATVSGVSADACYSYAINQRLQRPDPASRFQPEGVHGPSVVVDPSGFSWTDGHWRGLPLDEFIIYELHVGTFTPEGTFDGVISKLPYLRDAVGVTALELMPVAQSPGVRNWGYDGAYLFAPQANYGGPVGLKRLVDACHVHGLAVIMDVVYNHLGPEGNYLGEYGPYFTHRYQTPWGQAINYDGPHSDPVRHFVISNALYWIMEYHVDALRLDAIHGIFDFSAKHILQELGEAVRAQAKQQNRAVHVIAESDRNDARVITPVTRGGYGLDSQWSDDFHHALHGLLTGEADGYYADFGKLEHLATAIKDRFVYAGQYSAYRERRHGNSARRGTPTQFVVFSQNHDQVGNRAQGERLATLIPFEALKLAAAAVLLSANVPLLFMGEEYGETVPFLYFIDHGDADLIDAVRRGRQAEFASFGWGDVPDPHAPSTFDRSRLQWTQNPSDRQRWLRQWYQSVINLRKSIPALGPGRAQDRLKVYTHQKAQVLTLHRTGHAGPEALIILSLNKKPTNLLFKNPRGTWNLQLDSHAPEFGGRQETPAPPTLTVPQEPPSRHLPPYATWVYTSSSPSPGDSSLFSSSLSPRGRGPG